MKFLVLHAYSADNAGDGLLVHETLELLDEIHPGADIEVIALYPDSFRGLEARIISGSARSFRGIMSQYRAVRNLAQYDLVVGVGGGYLRAGRLPELLKTVVAHGIQLWAASKSAATPVAYLPQSVGPLRFGTRLPVTGMFRNIDRVYLRDDRSMQEVAAANPVRTPDLALLSRNYVPHTSEAPLELPVLSVRKVSGSVPKPVARTAEMLASFDGYVQSRGAGNDDAEAMMSLQPLRVIERAELLVEGGPKRVVIAVRLHAALMALNAGHWVIHLAYERKGFGAFNDLGLSEYVHNVNSFDPNVVVRQAQQLLQSSEARSNYAASVSKARKTLSASRSELISDLQVLINSK